MTGAAVFPMAPRPNGQGPGDLVPMLPVRLSLGRVAVDVTGLVDTGSTFSALPFDLGARFGQNWHALPTLITLGGALGGVPAKVLLLQGVVGTFPPTPLIFGWAVDNSVPVLFGMANFFVEFDVCFFRGRPEFHVQPRTP